METKDTNYSDAAKSAIDYMLAPIEKGGTAIYEGDDLLLKEYTHLPVVLNGWIFAWWGLMDYVTLTQDTGSYSQKLRQSCDSIVRYLPAFANRYWSRYDLGNKLASPFYHNLHIAQMQAMYRLTGRSAFNEYALRWKSQANKIPNKSLAFIVKAAQKILE